MASTIIRDPLKSGLVLLESSVDVADDGFIQVPARFLAPATNFNASLFNLDRPWSALNVPLPIGLPANQGGPFVLSRSIYKKNGLTYIDAVYVSAVNPVRVQYIDNTEKMSFTAFLQDEDDETKSTTLSFDYMSINQTVNYALVAGNYVAAQPYARLVGAWNFRQEGAGRRPRWGFFPLIQASKESFGLVTRFSATARMIAEQLDGGVIIQPISALDVLGGSFSFTYSSTG